MLILGIESSCDDSSIAIYSPEKGIQFYWRETHKEPSQYGGVVPELAARVHVTALQIGLGEALNFCVQREENLSGIAFTAGPGLFGSLWVGASFAQTLAWSKQIPLFPVDHLEGHIFSPFIGCALADIPFPFLALMVSDGHTQLWMVQHLESYQLLGTTRDDAAGEALDKGARFMGLGYPGGIHISQLAKHAKATDIAFPLVNLGKNSLEFSFSGLKSSLRRKIDLLSPLTETDKCSLSYAYEHAIVQTLLHQVEKALQKTKVQNLVVVGGVSANDKLRKETKARCLTLGVKTFFPELKYTGDNGAMIAYLGSLYQNAKQRGISPEVRLPIYAVCKPNLIPN